MVLNKFVDNGSDSGLINSLPTENIPEYFIKSMNRAGLVQKQVTVHGKNGDYQAMKWVRAADDKANVGVVKIKQPDTKNDNDSVDYTKTVSGRYQRIIDELTSEIKKNPDGNGLVTIKLYSDYRTATSNLANSKPSAPEFKLNIDKDLESKLKKYAKENDYELNIYTDSKTESISRVRGSGSKQTTKTRWATFTHIPTNKKWQERILSNMSNNKPSDNKSEPKQVKGGPVDISKFSFKNYLNPDGQNRDGYKTYRESLQSVANETEKEFNNALNRYNGKQSPYDTLSIAFNNINTHSSYRDMVGKNAEQGLKDAKNAILSRQKELLESAKEYTKWDDSQKKWVKDSEASDVQTSGNDTQKPPAKGYVMEIRTGASYMYVYSEKPTKASAIEAYEKAGGKLKGEVVTEVIKRSNQVKIDSNSVKDLCVNITKDGEYGLPSAVQTSGNGTQKPDSTNSTSKSDNVSDPNMGKTLVSSQTSGNAGQKLTSADAKKKTQSFTSKVGKSDAERNAFMDKVKASGITWNRSDNKGIDWMRCCMAMNKYFAEGGTFDE